MKINEFNEVINALNIYNPVRIEDNNEIHKWNNLEISFNKSFVTVNGKIPLEVANELYNKYDNQKYGIRLNGLMNNPNPLDNAIDDKYIITLINLQRKNLNTNQFIKRGKLAKKELLRRDNKDKYISSYHIDTKEGFITFIDEMITYLDNKDNNKTFIKK